jgi:alpha-D-xyloside xylohydrolase
MRDLNFQAINDPQDVSVDFGQIENRWFIANRLREFDPQTGCGLLEWTRHQRKPRLAFNQIIAPLEPTSAWEFPPEYGEESVLPFSLEFITERAVRMRLSSRADQPPKKSSPMLVGEPGHSTAWRFELVEGGFVWRSSFGSVKLTLDPWHVEFRDAQDRLLTRSQHLGDTKCLQNSDPTPFAYVRRTVDLQRTMAAGFSLSPDEKIYGCGESFTRLNKRGQKVVLWTNDAHGVQTGEMYKPIPFFLSSRGYGMFVHSTAPMTFDFGRSYDGATSLYVGDEAMDVFIFFGEPKDALSEYTALTGRSPTPPLWSFGLWMSRMTYNSAVETREVASKMREHRIPCDVVHLDTGWFEKDWRCDYEFSASRFGDPERMIQDLRKQGLRISVWQLPYFTPTNALYREAVSNGYVVKNSHGTPATEDAILDFSNPEAVAWYQALLERLLKMGVGAIKVDFGEGAPLHGLYASGSTGWMEHNLYPLRYNAAVADVTTRVTGEHIIWARSAWAGSQRYPIHWGGDAENTDCAMAASLRGGLSLGLCGFSFWSHDIGGFVRSPIEALYRRWMPFGMLTSHSRCHGAAPKEPWHFGGGFMDDFRRATELKYRLMPYVWAQARISSEKGWPMLRPLFFAYPEDPGSWLVEDEYFFGADLLVAPLMEETTARAVYLPPGVWIDYQDGKVYSGGQWHVIEAGIIPCIVLVREGAAIPHAELAQCCEDIDWNRLSLVIFLSAAKEAAGDVSLPTDGVVHRVLLHRRTDDWELVSDPLKGKVTWTMRQAPIL